MTNSYAYKFSILGEPQNIFYGCAKIGGISVETEAGYILDLLLGFAVSDIKKIKEIDIEKERINFELITLLSSCPSKS